MRENIRKLQSEIKTTIDNQRGYFPPCFKFTWKLYKKLVRANNLQDDDFNKLILALSDEFSTAAQKIKKGIDEAKKRTSPLESKEIYELKKRFLNNYKGVPQEKATEFTEATKRFLESSKREEDKLNKVHESLETVYTALNEIINKFKQHKTEDSK